MRKYSTFDLWIRVILLILISIILLFSFQVFGHLLAESLITGGEHFPSTLEYNFIRSMNGLVGVGLVYVFLKFDRQKLEYVGLSWNKKYGWEWIILGIPITLAALIPTVVIELVFEIVTFNELLDVLSILIIFLVSVVAIGLGEEILFRGYLQTILETKYSFRVSALISTFLFAQLHFWLLSLSGNLFNMIAVSLSAFVIGMAFSYVYKATKYNLILPVSIHGFWDFFLFIFEAEFIYDSWAKVVLEIGASIIGALIIFSSVSLYAFKRLKPKSNGN